MPPEPPGYDPDFPTDEVWPSNPALGNYYCETSMLYHPLVSAMGARDWIGCPPFYMAIGSKERTVNVAKFVAQNVAKQGMAVLWDEYELIPHTWPMGIHIRKSATTPGQKLACVSSIAQKLGQMAQ